MSRGLDPCHLAPVMRTFAFVLAFLSLALPARADTEPDFEMWALVVADVNLDRAAPGLRAQMELQARRMNAPLRYATTPPSQNSNTMLLVRPSIGYAFRPWAVASLGYAYTPVWFDDPAVREASNVAEHRVWEQLSLTLDRGSFGVSSRTRLEQRVRTDGPGDGEWAHRVRQMVRAHFRPVAGKPFLLVAYDEIFVHLDDSAYVTEAGFDQNRAFLGLGYDAGGARFEAGYLNQFVRRFGQPHQLNHAFVSSLTMKFGRPRETAPR